METTIARFASQLGALRFIGAAAVLCAFSATSASAQEFCASPPPGSMTSEVVVRLDDAARAWRGGTAIPFSRPGRRVAGSGGTTASMPDARTAGLGTSPSTTRAPGMVETRRTTMEGPSLGEVADLIGGAASIISIVRGGRASQASTSSGGGRPLDTTRNY